MEFIVKLFFVTAGVAKLWQSLIDDILAGRKEDMQESKLWVKFWVKSESLFRAIVYGQLVGNIKRETTQISIINTPKSIVYS